MDNQTTKIDWQQDADTLFLLCCQEPDQQKRARLQVLWLLRQGWNLKQIAQILGIHYRTAHRWLAWYRQGGVQELQRRRRGGYTDKAPGLTLTQQAALKPSQTALCFIAQESVPDGIRRIALEQIDRALGQLVDLSNDRDKAIHDARKCFKKMRAILRLVRGEIGEAVFKQENTCYRDAGQLISALRDSAVLVETLDKLSKHYAKQLRAKAFAGIRAKLVARHQTVYEQMVNQSSAVDEVVSIIEAARIRVADWPIEHDDFSALSGGLRRVYQRGRNRLADAYAHPHPEIFHEWRKRLKYLWYHVRILQDLWPEQMDGLASLLKDLSDVLGDAHDLIVLQEVLLAEPDTFDDAKELEVLLPLINQRQRELQAAAHFSGRRIYSESPKVFIERIADYWQIWQDEAQATGRS